MFRIWPHPSSVQILLCVMIPAPWVSFYSCMLCSSNQFSSSIFHLIPLLLAIPASAALAAAQATLDCQSSSSSSGGLSAIHMDGPHALLTSLWSADTGGPEEIENILRFSFEASLETDEGLREAISQIKGCVIRHCKIHDCHGGLAVSQQGQARLEKCEFSEMLFGVRCVQNAKVWSYQFAVHHSPLRDSDWMF